MAQRITVLKIYVSCDKCKQKAVRIVSSLQGVNKIEVEQENDRLTVIGEADPSAIVTRLRKKGKRVDMISVGPFPPPDNPTPPAPAPAPNPTTSPTPDPPKYACPCQGGRHFWEPIAIMTLDYPAPGPSTCSIL